MKNQVFNSKSLFLSLLLIIGISFSLSAQKEVKKEISESYKVSQDFTLEVENKYGSIDIVNWDKKELEVVIEMVVKAPSEEKAQKILDKIDVDINESGNGVAFVTQMDIKNMGNKINVEVNYKISAPSSINAKLTQKYGGIFIEELTGDVSLVIKYGNLMAQSLVNKKDNVNELVLAYSNAEIAEAGKLEAKLAYSEIKLESVGSYEGKLAYSKLAAVNLTGKLVLDAAYSSVKVENVVAGFKTINVTAAYGNVKIGMDAEAAYTYEMESKYGGLNAPAGAVKVSENDHDHGPDHHKAVKGSVGSSPTGKVIVSVKYGNAYLK